MRKLQSLYVLLGVLLMCGACRQAERVVERPSFGMRTSETLEIDKIVINDTATVFYMDAYADPRTWIRIDSATYLKAGDQKYFLLRGEGIKVGDYHWMPDSGRSSFQLIFPPLPGSLKRIDFIESDCDECFKIFDIQLQPGAAPISYADLVPAELRVGKEGISDSLPEPIFGIGRTKVKVHLLGYRPEMKMKAEMYLNNFLTLNQEAFLLPVDAQGICQFEFDQYGTNYGFVITPLGSSSFILAPGEEAEVYIDLAVSSRRSSPYQKDKSGIDSYYRGYYADLCRAIQLDDPKYYMQMHSLEFHKTISTMNPDQYVAYVMQKYHTVVDSIWANPELLPLSKKYWQLWNRAEAIMAIANAKSNMVAAYRTVNNVPWEQREIDYRAPEFTDKQFRVLKELEVNDPKLFYFQTYTHSYPSLYSIDHLTDIVGTDKGTLFDLQKVQGIAERLENLEPLTSEQKAALKSIDDPFYAQAFEYMESAIRAKVEASKQKTGYRICEVPQVPNQKLFEAIIAPYKGKVVLVDFWATWCGPCREAIRELESLKSTVFKDKEIVFVYLTGESSPLATWQTTIPDIKGEHYRLIEEQWKYVSKQFDIIGIPAYMLVDKSGKYKRLNEEEEGDLELTKLLLEAESRRVESPAGC